MGGNGSQRVSGSHVSTWAGRGVGGSLQSRNAGRAEPVQRSPSRWQAAAKRGT